MGGHDDFPFLTASRKIGNGANASSVYFDNCGDSNRDNISVVICGAESEIGACGVCAVGLCGILLGSERREMVA